MPLATRALSNLTGMARGRQPWNVYQNDLQHWIKHASTLGRLDVPSTRSLRGIRDEDHYLAVAREICRRAAQGLPGTEVKLRETIVDDTVLHDYVVWYVPPGASLGVFLIVKDCHDHGELETMFSPREGREYFDKERGVALH